MKYDDLELVNIYNENTGEKITITDISPILSKINLVIERIELDEVEIMDLIDTMLLFKENNLLNKLNEKLLNLLSLILGNENNEFYQEDSLYLMENLRFLLLPFNLNKCPHGKLLSSYLANFDIFLNKLVMLDVEKIMILKDYNQVLFDVVIRLKYLTEKYRGNELFNKLSTLDNMIIDTTLSHLGTMLYLNLSEFDYDYDLVVKVFDKIMNEYLDFAYICGINGIYKDITCFNSDSENIINEYLLCKNMLEYEHKSPIKVKKYS